MRCPNQSIGPLFSQKVCKKFDVPKEALSCGMNSE